MWSVKRIEEAVTQLVPSATDVTVSFPAVGVVRVIVKSEAVWGIQPRVKTMLEQALPKSIQRVEVIVGR